MESCKVSADIIKSRHIGGEILIFEQKIFELKLGRKKLGSEIFSVGV